MFNAIDIHRVAVKPSLFEWSCQDAVCLFLPFQNIESQNAERYPYEAKLVKQWLAASRLIYYFRNEQSCRITSNIDCCQFHLSSVFYWKGNCMFSSWTVFLFTCGKYIVYLKIINQALLLFTLSFSWIWIISINPPYFRVGNQSCCLYPVVEVVTTSSQPKNVLICFYLHYETSICGHVLDIDQLCWLHACCFKFFHFCFCAKYATARSVARLHLPPLRCIISG